MAGKIDIDQCGSQESESGFAAGEQNRQLLVRPIIATGFLSTLQTEANGDGACEKRTPRRVDLWNRREIDIVDTNMLIGGIGDGAGTASIGKSEGADRVPEKHKCRANSGKIEDHKDFVGTIFKQRLCRRPETRI